MEALKYMSWWWRAGFRYFPQVCSVIAHFCSIFVLLSVGAGGWHCVEERLRAAKRVNAEALLIFFGAGLLSSVSDSVFGD